MREPFWIEDRLVRVMHADLLSQHGGRAGIRDEHMLAASLGRPRHLFAYGDAPTIFDLAAAYGYGLAKNHPFVDGNKRVAFVVMAVFLELNGYSLDALEMEVVVMMERLATDEESQDSLAEWLRQNSTQQ